MYNSEHAKASCVGTLQRAAEDRHLLDREEGYVYAGVIIFNPAHLPSPFSKLESFTKEAEIRTGECVYQETF